MLFLIQAIHEGERHVSEIYVEASDSRIVREWLKQYEKSKSMTGSIFGHCQASEDRQCGGKHLFYVLKIKPDIILDNKRGGE